MLEFRALTYEDMPLMLDWLARDHVKEWWDDGDDTMVKVERHYGTATDGVERFILIYSGLAERPIGYFQSYYNDDGSIGIDQFIGDGDLINKGIGTAAVSAFVDLIRDRFDPPYIMLDPHPDNARAIRCYEKAGFEHYATVQDPGGVQAYIMRLYATRISKSPGVS